MGDFDIFDEWDAYAKSRDLLPRALNFKSIIRNSAIKIVAIMGIRRCGKSSLLMLLAQHLMENGNKVAYVNLEDSRLASDRGILDNILVWFGEKGFLLLDEITSAHDWEGWLARTHEFLKGNIHLIVSSSIRSLVQPNKPLRGRILPIELYPLSFKEFLSFKGIKVEKTTIGHGKIMLALEEYLKFGGFPEVVLVEEKIDKIRILNSYFRDIIAMDIAEVSHEDISIVETFGKYIIQAMYFSASKCLNFFKSLGYKIGKQRILSLERFAQLGYLFFFVPIFSYNIKDRSQYARKAYCGDTGFYYSESGKVDYGKLYENAVFLQLKRDLQGMAEINYWKNSQGWEVDFIIRRGNKVIDTIQVVYEFDNKKTQIREIRDLVACVKELGADRAIVITKDTEDEKTIDGIHICFVPLVKWLMEGYSLEEFFS